MARDDAQPAGDLPAGLTAPARRALAAAGCTRLAQLTSVSEAELLRLHGMGLKALAQLREALAAPHSQLCVYAPRLLSHSAVFVRTV